MGDSTITSQLLLAVKAREAFRTETDSIIAAKVSGIFPGATQQTLKLRRTAYVNQKKKDETKKEDDEHKKSDIQVSSLQNVLMGSESAEDREDGTGYAPNEGSSSENKHDGADASGVPRLSIQEEYTLIQNSILRLEERSMHLKKMLIRAKLLTMDTGSTSVEAARLEYLSNRLVRLRQLNSIPHVSERKVEARESYTLWANNQRNLTIRKAKLDIEEARRKKNIRSKDAVSTPERSRKELGRVSNGIGVLFGGEESTPGGRHVKFESSDPFDSERRFSFFGGAEIAAMPDPLSQGHTTVSEIIESRCQELINRHELYLVSLRRMDDLPIPQPSTASREISLDHDVMRCNRDVTEKVTPSAAGGGTTPNRQVSFSHTSSTSEESSKTLTTSGLSLNHDFTSFTFDDDPDSTTPHISPPPPSKAHSPPAPPKEGAKTGAISIAAHTPAPDTPSAKMHRRFSMSKPLDVFSSFVETKNTGNNDTISIPPAFREVAEDGSTLYNPRHLKLASILKSFTTSSASNLGTFEREEVEQRMRRCLEFACAAVQNKFVVEGDQYDSSDAIETFRQRIAEKEISIQNTAEYMKKIADGIADGYFQEVKNAHQMVLQQQLGRLERFQSRIPKSMLEVHSENTDSQSTLRHHDRHDE